MFVWASLFLFSEGRGAEGHPSLGKREAFKATDLPICRSSGSKFCSESGLANATCFFFFFFLRLNTLSRSLEFDLLSLP